MKFFKMNISLILGIVFILLVTDVESGVEEDIQNAFQSLGNVERSTLSALTPSFLENLIAIAKCIEKLATPINLCNFKTSYDPLYYFEMCAKNTTIYPLIDTFIKGIPVAKFDFGIPNKVSKDRCFTGLSALKSVVG
nr:venom protein [Lampona murina]